jgi:2-keto-4-pentenoate hydratase
MKPWEDPRIMRGMTAQFAKLRARVAAGETPLGWKVGLGSPAAMERLKLQAPVVAFLMQGALLPNGGSTSFKGYTKPVAECEIAVRMAKDLGAGATAGDALAAVKEITPAIELADFDPPPTPDNIDTVLAGDIYNRHVILGSASRAGGSVAGLTSRLIRRGAEAARTSDPEALTGKLTDIVALVANTVAAYGEKLSAGDIIITGSITPPIMLEPDEAGLTHALEPIGEVSVHFSW